ncbi:MAG: ABC transporter ATP-binding protein [Chloroflexi bacterium]|nr:ABC transporter ATP-binding protein [Chloroflexota bacterium]
MQSSGNPVIKLENLTKHYGEIVGIQDLSLEVTEGEVFGLLGPNGAGKTTTIRLILDFIRPTSGKAAVFGLSPRSDGTDIRRRVGYLPGDFVTYDHMTGATVTEYFTHLRGADPVKLVALCERYKLDLSRKIGQLSKGNKQKIGLVQAFMNDPDLLILDEPTAGLDPLLQYEFQKMIHEEKAQGKTIFMSSHVMSEVEATCDRVGIIREGKLVTIDTVSHLTELSLWTAKITFTQPVPYDTFNNLPGITVTDKTDDRTYNLSISGEGSMDTLIKSASKHPIQTFESQHASLEDAFLKYYSGEEAEE